MKFSPALVALLSASFAAATPVDGDGTPQERDLSPGLEDRNTMKVKVTQDNAACRTTPYTDQHNIEHRLQKRSVWTATCYKTGSLVHNDLYWYRLINVGSQGNFCYVSETFPHRVGWAAAHLLGGDPRAPL